MRTVIGGEATELSQELDLTLRADGRGGDLLPNVMSSGDTENARQRFVILVHGFNVDRDEAFTSYAGLHNNLGLHGTVTRNDFKNFFWPGDPRVVQFPRRTPTDYAKAVNIAKSSGKKLAEYIETRAANGTLPNEIVFVAHSLGCRLVLETVAALQARGSGIPARIDVILMAAAVPTEFVDLTGHLNAAVRSTKRRIVVYSYNDSVLQRWFPIGQTLSDDNSPDGVEAVGLHGRPSTLWSELKPRHHLDHGGYWRSSTVARVVSEHLHLRPARDLHRRDLSSRTLSSDSQHE